MNHVLYLFINKFVVVYLDNITIYSKTYNEHLKHVYQALKKLKKAHLKLILKKCSFFLNTIEFLRHIINRDGITPDKKKIIKIKDFPIPKTLKQLCAFLGLASYYRKFIKRFSKIAKPLNNLLKKDEPYQWNKDQDEAFNTLKTHLITALVRSEE